MGCSVSVILPVFNCERYLKRAIESVINQNLFYESELILVDDGSTDGSPSICDLYSEKYDNIKVIHQENSGVSVARNNGIVIASGEWITFLDSDDYLLPGALSVIKQHKHSDIICTEYESNITISSDIFNYLSFGTFDVNSYWDTLIRSLIGRQYFYTCWSKYFRRSIIKNNNISFPVDRKIAEDMVFVYSYLPHCSTLTISDMKTYFYNVNEDNTTNIVSESYDTIKFIYDWKTEYFKKLNCYSESIRNSLIGSFLWKSFFSIKSTATHDTIKNSMIYLKSVFNDHEFCSLYTENYSSFKTFSDKVLDWSIRHKNPLPFCLLSKFIKIISKG
jgi:glycosyltransferase involved in cell wall biosynthesis